MADADTHAADGWRLYYTEDRAYSSADTEWVACPDDGVLALVLYYDAYTDGGVQYRKVLTGDDHYFHVPGTDLYGCNNDSIPEIEARYPGAVVKRGKWTTHAEMTRVEQRAYHTTCPDA